MLPGLNFDSSIANLTALHGIGGLPHPIMPGAPPIRSFVPPAQGPAPPMPVAPTPAQMPMQGMPLPTGAPMPIPLHMDPNIYSYGMPQGPMQGGGLNNMQALMQLLGQRRYV